MAILLYASRERTTTGLSLIPFKRIEGIDANLVFVRAEHIDETNLVAALDHARPLDGETFLNAIPDRL